MADTEDSAPPYNVGYRRPPRGTQFQKGRSGNPKGRPKGSLNFSSLIEKELKAKVTVNENGMRKRITKKHAIAKQLVNRAASGDPKAIPTLLNEERSNHIANPAAGKPPLAADDQRVLDNLIARISGARRPNVPDDLTEPSAPSIPSNDIDARPEAAP